MARRVVVGHVSHDYRYVSANLAYPAAAVAELPLTGVTWGRMLNGAGEFQGNLKLPPPTTVEARLLLTLWREATDRATKVIYVIRDDVPLGCYIIWTQSYSSADQTIALGGAELFSYFRRRVIEDTSGDLTVPLVFTDRRPADIAGALVAAVGGGIGLIPDVVAAGATLSKTYRGTDARVMAEELLELAALDDGGFDFRTDVRLTSAGTYERLWVARDFLGGTTEIVAKYETNVAKLSVDRRGDLRANDAVVLGPTGADGTIRANARRSTLDWGPVMSVVEAHSGEEEPAAVMERRAVTLLDATVHHELLQVSVVASSIDAQLGTFHPGDVMRLVANPGSDPFFADGLDTSVRLLGYTVTVPDTGAGAELVDLTFEGSK
jgi:hypothetical protein